LTRVRQRLDDAYWAVMTYGVTRPSVRPRPSFMRWIRRVLILFWGALLWFGLPPWVARYHRLPAGPGQGRPPAGLVRRAARPRAVPSRPRSTDCTAYIASG